MTIQAIIVGLSTCAALAAAGCAGAAKSEGAAEREGAATTQPPRPQTISNQSRAPVTPPYALPSDQLVEDGRFLAWELGAPLEADEQQLETEGDSIYLLREPVTIGGRQLDRVALQTTDGTLDGVILEIQVSGAEQARSLGAWMGELCAPFTDQVRRHVPSPLGTPPAGEDNWDPAQISEARCDGEVDGVSVSIRENQNFDSTYHHSRVTITLSPAIR